MSAESVAADHYRDRQRLAQAAGQVAQDAWRQVDPGNIVRSWQASAPQVTVAVAGAQRAAALQADSYLDEVLSELGLPAGADGSVNPAAFAGVASDGRPLDSLFAQPANVATYALASGHSMPRSLAAGQASLGMMVATQVADAGRTADQVSLVAHRSVSGYVRVLNPPSCSRCAILAGRWYRYSAGFQRHPRCDCFQLPAPENIGRDLTTDPRQYFDSLTLAEQDQLFTKAGAQAIRDGADMAQVVNARRGMHTAGGRRLTTTSTTRMGSAPGRPRLMPEEIYKIASSRDEAIRLLQQNGYVRAAPRVVSAPRLAPRVPAPAPVAVPVAPRPTLRTTSLPAPARRVTLETPTLPIPAARQPRRLDHGEAVDLMERMTASEPWTRAQMAALAAYSGAAYLDMNALLRGRIDDPDSQLTVPLAEVQREIRDANAGMRPLPEPVVTFRRTDREAFGVEELDDLLGLVGQQRQEAGFLSTSIRDDLYPELGEVFVEVRAPAGTRAAYIDPVSEVEGAGIEPEREMLFAPGRRFTILEAVRVGDSIHLVIELIV